MGAVYHARHPETRESLALKILKDEHHGDQEAKEHFMREARTTAGMDHPNIIAIRRVGDLDGVPFLLMTFMNGGSLQERLRGGYPLTTAAAIDIALQLSKALGYAHDQGVLHLDLKPTNILFSANQAQVRLGDFGIARTPDSTTDWREKPGTVMATPRYMSPEQASGSEPDERSDLFSLGVILYEMLCGKKAFDGNTLPELIEQVKTRTPTPLASLSPDLPVGVVRIVEKLLQKKASNRYPDARTLQNALEQELARVED